MNRKMKWMVFGFILTFGVSLIGNAIKLPGFLPKIIGLIGVFVVIKGIFLLTAKTSEKLFAWWSQRPLWLFRLWALFILAMGIILFS